MFRVSILFVLACLIATPAFPAVITTYSSQASFEGALTNLQKINFSVEKGTYTDYSSKDLIDSTGTIFHNQGGAATYALFVNIDPPYLINSKASLVIPYDPGSSVLITFQTPVSGFAMNAMTLFGAGSLVITLPETGYTGSFSVPLGNGVAPAYIAFTSDIPFSTLQVSSTAGSRGMFNGVEFGQAATQQSPPTETAEVSTFLMIGTGLAMLRLTQRKLMPLC